LTRRAILGAVALTAVAVFVPSLWGRFVADDFSLLHTVDGVTSVWSPFAHNDLGQGVGSGHFYRPLWVLWNTAIFHVFGGSAGAFHALNLALFALVAIEVRALARHVLSPARALVAAFGFALYPRHGESVAWISGNTDLLATALGLASLLALLGEGSARRRVVMAVALAVAAALTKESAFLLPVLGFLVLREKRSPLLWRGPVAIALALLGVLVVRAVIVGGAGGYTDEPVTPRRVLASAASYLAATVTPPQLEILRSPLLALIPLGLLALAAVGTWRLRADGDSARLRVVVLGLAWFAVSIVPVLGEPLDLNNATGERLLFLPSVGLALALAALLPEPSTSRRLAGMAAAAAVAAGLCLLSASNWVTAGEIAEQTARDAARLAPPGGELLVLSVPESYRTAHVFTNSFDLAAERAGAENVLFTWCIPVQVRHRRSNQISFRPNAGTFVGSTSWSAPFDFPVVGELSALTPGCAYAREPGASGTPGLELGGVATPRPARRRLAIAYFDGRSLERLR
jgi:hypothetical protein